MVRSRAAGCSDNDRQFSSVSSSASLPFYRRDFLENPPFPRTISAKISAQIHAAPTESPSLFRVAPRPYTHIMKRKASPGASSRSSATPAPSIALPQTSSALHLDTPSSPAPVHDEPSVPGPSRGSTSATPARGLPIKEERMEARMGVIVPGSADGGPGEECYMWADLPMNKQGASR